MLKSIPRLLLLLAFLSDSSRGRVEGAENAGCECDGPSRGHEKAGREKPESSIASQFVITL